MTDPVGQSYRSRPTEAAMKSLVLSYGVQQEKRTFTTQRVVVTLAMRGDLRVRSDKLISERVS